MISRMTDILNNRHLPRRFSNARARGHTHTHTHTYDLKISDELEKMSQAQ